MATSSRDTLSLDGGFLKVDLREARQELAASLRALRRARQLVVSDPDILGGEPVFRHTRVTVHLIATLLMEGSTVADLFEGYPRLTADGRSCTALCSCLSVTRSAASSALARPGAGTRQRQKLATIDAG